MTIPSSARKDHVEDDRQRRSELVAQNQNQGFSAGGGGFLRVLGIIYLIKIIRRRRARRRLAGPDGPAPEAPAR